MKLTLYIVGCTLFLISSAAHLFVRLRLNPKDDPELEDYYHEFEHHHPGYARYTKWLQITLTAAIIGALLFFTAIAV